MRMFPKAAAPAQQIQQMQAVLPAFQEADEAGCRGRCGRHGTSQTLLIQTLFIVFFGS